MSGKTANELPVLTGCSREEVLDGCGHSDTFHLIHYSMEIIRLAVNLGDIELYRESMSMYIL